MYDAETPITLPEPIEGPGTPFIRASERKVAGCGNGPSDAQLDIEERRLVDTACQNRAAFAPLYRRYVTRVYRYFYQQVATREDAEDLTASTFSKALIGLDKYEARGTFAAWLFGIARHTLIDYWRARYAAGSGAGVATGAESIRGGVAQVDLGDVASSLEDPTPGPETRLLLSEQAIYLRHLVATLPEGQREALVLRIFGGLRTRDVSAVLGKSDGAVKMLVHRAIETLRVRYSTDSQEAGS